jgi:hypothetical protein
MRGTIPPFPQYAFMAQVVLSYLVAVELSRNEYEQIRKEQLEKTKQMKVKGKLSLCLTKHHAMKAFCGSGGIAPRILDLGTRWR